MMIRGVITCVAFGASVPAVAGAPHIPIPLPGLRLVAATAIADPKAKIPVRESRVVPARSSVPLPRTYERFDLDAKVAPVRTRAAPSEDRVGALFTLADAPRVEGWRNDRENGETTSNAGAYYAVRDVMVPRRYRHRGSAMLTLKLDGVEESEPISMGGVPGMVWQIVPK